MRKNRILAVIMTVFMALSLLPSMIFAAEAATVLEGELKIKGSVTVGSTLSADYTKVKPEGMTDDNVSFLWSRKTDDEGEPVEVSREKTYTVKQEDLGCKIVLAVTGLEEKGFSGTLKATSAAVSGGAEEPASEETQNTEEQAPERNEAQENGSGENDGEEVIPEAHVEEQTYSEEELTPTEEPQGEEEQEIPEMPEEMQQTEEPENDDWLQGENTSEELFPITISSSSDPESVVPGTETEYRAEASTEDGTGTLDFGTVTEGSEGDVDVQYVTVTNTGSGTLHFEGLSPEHFMVQDIGEPLEPGEDVRLWVQPREGITAGDYNDTITYTSEEGATASVQVSVSVQAAGTQTGSDDPEPLLEPEPTIAVDPDPLEEPEPQLAIEVSPSVLDFGSLVEGYASAEAQTVTVKNTGTSQVTVVPATSTSFEVTLDLGETDAVLASGESLTYQIKPVQGLSAGDYPETLIFGIEGTTVTASVTAKVIVTGAPVTNVTVNPDSLNFGSRIEGYGEAPAGQTVTLKNEGTVDVTIGRVDGAGEYDILDSEGNTLSLENLPLTADAPLSFNVRPKLGLAAGDHSTSVLIVPEGSDAPLATIRVNFTVDAKVFSLSATPSLDFGSQEEGYTEAPAVQTVTVTNNGNMSVTLQQPSATGYTVGALSAATVQPGESASFTVRPNTGLSQGSYECDLQIPNNEGISASVHLVFKVTEKVVKLEALQKLSEITGLKNGTKKTAADLKLPSTMLIRTNNGNMKVNVTWDVAGCAYDPSALEAQTFTVRGTVKLPDGVTNPNNVSLNTSIKVTVGAYSPKLASAENNKITGISSDGGYTTQSKISFTAVGAGMDNANPRKGDTRYVPANWTVINTNSWSGAPYTATFGLAESGSYTLKVVFNQQKYDGSNWVNTGEQDTKKIVFNVAKAQVTSVPGQNLTPAAAKTNANRKSSVKTGDNTVVVPFVIALVAAVGCIAGVIIYRKKK